MKAAVYRVLNTALFDSEEVIALFDRAFPEKNKFGIDAAQMLEFLKRDVSESDPWLLVWLAHHPRHGWCGFSIVTYTPTPVSPNPCIAHLHCDIPECRDPLVSAGFTWALSKGIGHCTIVNATGRSDEAHLRLFRKFGKGERIGTLINYDIRDRA